MTKNMKTTKHNKKEASEAKKEHPKKGISPCQRNSSRVSPLCHSENLIVCNFHSNPPTHSKSQNDVLHGNMNMEVTPNFVTQKYQFCFIVRRISVIAIGTQKQEHLALLTFEAKNDIRQKK